MESRYFEMESHINEMESHKIIPHRLLLVLLGFTSMSLQVILIREAMALFRGNELVIGLFMGTWMLLTATGALVSSKFQVPGSKFFPMFFSKADLSASLPPRFHASLLLTLALLPLFTLFLIITMRFAIIPGGIMTGPGLTALVFLLSLAPFCLVSGMLFPILVQSLSALRGKNLLHEGYALESLGGVAGGILFSTVLLFTLPPFESLVLICSFCSLFLSVLWFVMRKTVMAIASLVTGILVFHIPFNPRIAGYLDQKQFNRQDVVEIKSTPVGMIAVTRTDEQVFIYENGIPVNTGEDIITSEESVHYAMLLHQKPGKVLMISGASNGSIEEVLKYPQSHLDYIDRDPWLLKVVEKYNPMPRDPRVNYFYDDARIHLKKSKKKYDVILINTSEPESAEMNRYYTVEFYKLLKDRLYANGIISVSTQPAGNYMNETSRQVHSVIFNTLRSVFSQVRIIPGGKDYFIASDTTIEQSIFNNFQNKEIATSYVNPFYISEELLKMRSDLILKEIQPNTQINSDLKPYIFSLFLKQWLERFKANARLIPLILILLLTLSLIYTGPLNLGLFAGGFTASGLEFILLIWFQVIYGNVYWMTGVIFAVFMLGLVLGSWIFGNKQKNNTFRGFLVIQGIIAVFSLMIFILLKFLSTVFTGLIASAMILILVSMTGLITGIQFSYSASLRKTSVLKSSGESYGADLLGSAIGVVLVSVYVVPALGLPLATFSLAGLNLLAIGVMAVKRRR